LAFNLASITNETRLRAPRIILLGVEKIGKSTFASQSDRPIFIPIKGEEGIDSIAVPQFPTCNSPDDVMDCLCSLYQEENNFGTVVIDSATALEPVIFTEVCKVNKAKDINSDGLGYGRGYREANKHWRKITEALDALRNDRGIASIIIGHVKVKRFDSPDSGSWDQWQFQLNDLAAGLLYQWADVILFANTKVVVRTEDVGFGKDVHRGIDIASGQRFLYTQKNPAFPSGGRGIYGQLPAELSLNWGSFMDAVATATKVS
jgi:hypothetical protein